MKPNFESELQAIKTGHHACLFYDDVEITRLATVAFIKIGLQRHERCLYMADPLSIAEITIRLNAAGVDVNREVSRGALQLTSEREHLVDGRFSAERMIESLGKAIDYALKTGFQALRGSGDVIWELGSDVDMEKLANYEKMLDAFFPGKRLVGLCQYNCNVIPETYLKRSLLTHNVVVYDHRVCLHNTNHDPHSLPQEGSFKELLSQLR